MAEPDWDRINKKKEVDIAVGQAINIIADRGKEPTTDNTEYVMRWVDFILDCKEKYRQKEFKTNEYNNGGDI